MAECFFNIDNMPMTINFCNKSLRESIDRKQENNLPEIYYLRAQAFLIQGKTDRAKKDLQEAMERDPEYDEPRQLMDRIEEEQ